MAESEWELSKENVQPLKQGRKVSTLNSVLHYKDEDTQKHLQEQRTAFETELRSYSGSDPLDPWYRYISWVEQSFPKGGKDGKIHVLLEKCITRFKDDKTAIEDSRFLEVWLKYANMANTPLEVYKYMYNNGVCTQQAGLYDAWAWYLETQGSFKAAEAVYGKGLDALTDQEAKAGLKQRKVLFETRITKRLNGEEISQDEIYEQEQRCALGRLRGEGKHGKVGSIRIGGAVMSSNPGIHVPSRDRERQALKPGNNTAGGIVLYHDPAGSSGQPGGSSRKHSTNATGQENVAPRHSSIPSKADHKENNLAAGKWSENSKGKKNINVPLNKIGELAPKSGFTLYQDEGAAEDQRKASSIAPQSVQSGVLTQKQPEKEVSSIPVALFEPFDPTRRARYCKNIVYQGTTEFSFEELRAIKWREREKKRKEEEEIENKRSKLLQMEKALKERQDAMEKQMEEIKKLLVQQQQGPASSQVQESQATQLQDEKQIPRQSIQVPGMRVTKPSTSSSTTSMTLNSSNQTSSSTTPGRSGSEAHENGVGNCRPSNSSGSTSHAPVSLKSVTPSPHRSAVSSVGGYKPSPTVNTKAALAVMQELWSQNVDNTVADSSDDVFLPGAPKFEIYSDEGSKPMTSTAPKFEIFSDESQPKPRFEIFSDEPAKEPAAPAAPKFQIFSDEMQTAVSLPQHPESEKVCNAPFEIYSDQKMVSPAPNFEIYSDEKTVAAPQSAPFKIFSDENATDQENIPPEDYKASNNLARPRFGVLQPIEGAECMPLEEQEKLLDEEEKKQDEDGFTKPLAPSSLCAPGGGGAVAANATMVIPDPGEFEKMAAKLCSTPFSGRGYIPDDDENTCAVQLIYNNQQQLQQQQAAKQTLMEEPLPKDGCAGDMMAECEAGVASANSIHENGPAHTGLQLSPIVEVSQEYYRSSSSSSGTDTTHHNTRPNEFSKSHWSNASHTTLHQQHRTLGLGIDSTSSLSLRMRTPGTGLASLTGNSGYAGDKSSMYSNCSTQKGVLKKCDIVGDEVKGDKDDDLDNTGMLGMLSEFKQTLGVKKAINTSKSCTSRTVNQPEAMRSLPTHERLSALADNSRVVAADDSRHQALMKPTPVKLQFQGLDVTGSEVVNAAAPQLELTANTTTNELLAPPNISNTSKLAGGRVSPNVSSFVLDLGKSLNVERSPVNGQEQHSLQQKINLTQPADLEISKNSTTKINHHLDETRAGKLELTRQNHLDVTRPDHLELTRPGHLELTRPGHLELTRPGHLELTRPDHLNMTKPDHLELTKVGSLNLTKPDHLDMTKPDFLSLTKPDHPDMTKQDHLDVTKPDHLNLTKPDHLNMTKPDNLSTNSPCLFREGSDALAITPEMSKLDMTGQTHNEFLAPAPPVPIKGRLISLPLDDNTDPFSSKFQEMVLENVEVPVEKRHGYVRCNALLPQVRVNSLIQIGEDKFHIRSLKGEGGFAKVFSAVREDSDDMMNCTIAGIDAVLKVQKPANEWEWYICTEVQERLRRSNYAMMASSFMCIPRNYNFSNGSIFVSYHQRQGTLLDVANKLKGPNVEGPAVVSAALYFAIEILYLVEALHSIGILHADIKPDNFLLQRIPVVSGNVVSAESVFQPGNLSLQLIDFGKAIDLSILPKDVAFNTVVKTEGLYCVPMREKEKWCKHIDYYGAAASVYCVLFGQYMDVVKTKAGTWEEKGAYKRSWSNQALFKEFFREFINIKESLPSLKTWRDKFTKIFMDSMMYTYLKLD